MKSDTARAILAAAALMTVQALLLAALATSAAHSSTVYRCPPSAGTAVTYQTQPCTEGGSAPVRTLDTRTREQQSQAHASHARQMAWLDRQDSLGSPADKVRTPSKKRRAKRKNALGTNAPQGNATAVPLTSHRIGRRPFEGLGQEVSSTDRSVNKPKKHNKRSPYDLLARTPAPGKSTQQASSGNLKPSP